MDGLGLPLDKRPLGEKESWPAPSPNVLEGAIKTLRRTEVINIDQALFRVTLTLLVTVQRRHLWVVTPSKKYPVQFAPSQSI